MLNHSRGTTMRKNENEIKNKSDRFLSLIVTTLLILSVGGVSAEAQYDHEISGRENRTYDLISNIDSYSINDDRLQVDAAKAHYNMGNIYFQKGHYEIAAREYFQAITLMPNDPDAHYNLAFVSGEHLGDHKTALKHYKMYLYLNPSAKDRKFVNGKIVQAELELRAKVDSKLEEDLEKYR